MTKPMIEITNLCKRFGPLDVLRSVDLVVRSRRVIAIVGPNGAGKTTLIKSVLGLTRPDTGRIVLDGANVIGRDAYRSQLGYMPQIARFPENLTGAELVAMLKDLRGSAAQLDTELIDCFGLEEALGKPLRVLSGGTKQKVNAAMAFLFSPDLLILDEPTAGLDPLSSSILKDKILAERGAGKTVMVTSHIMNELEELADDVAFMLEGRMAFVGTLDELKRITSQTTLERAVAAMMTRGWVQAAA
ncbi:MAG TPA: ABC transporter ATP-binding protein [Gemmatimonadaceae bacterium]